MQGMFGAPGVTSSQDLDLVQPQRVTARSIPVPNSPTLSGAH